MKTRFFKLSVVSIALTLIYVSCAPQTSGDDSPLVGKSAPDFSLQTADNRTIRLSDFKGKVVVLDFWATWCPPCRQSLPNLNRLSNDPVLAKRGIKVLAVNARENAQQVSAFLDENHYALPVALDTDGSAEGLYNVTGLPTTVIIGRDNKIRNVLVGFDPNSTESQISTAIDKILAE